MTTNNASGRVFIVTGGSSGIGREICSALADAGERVLAVDLQDSDGSEERGISRIVQDVAREDAPEKIVEAALEEFGRVDGLVNCAGIFPTKPALDIQRRDWDELMGINLKAPFFLSQAVARGIIADGGTGTIVNISSSAGKVTRPEIAHYAASKSALISMTKTLALEWARFGIRVNAIAPGLVETPGVERLLEDARGRETHRRKIKTIPAGRPGNAAEMARCVAFLLSDDADFITGHTLVVDGGYSAGKILNDMEGRDT